MICNGGVADVLARLLRHMAESAAVRRRCDLPLRNGLAATSGESRDLAVPHMETEEVRPRNVDLLTFGPGCIKLG